MVVQVWPGLWAIVAAGSIELLSSSYAVAEAWHNLDLPQQRERLKGLLSALTVVPEPDAALPCPVDLPPKDRPVLLAAIQAGATHLVRGDLAHSALTVAVSLAACWYARPGITLCRLACPSSSLRTWYYTA